MMQKPPVILWLRQDLRLADNEALRWAASKGPIIPIYILDDCGNDPFPPGGASRWWLNETLKDLAVGFAKRGAPLVLKRGNPAKILMMLAKETKATAITWNRSYEPYARKRDDDIADQLETAGLEVRIYRSFLLFEPKEIKTKSGTPFKVYTPFSKACFAAQAPEQPLPAANKLQGVKEVKSDQLADWKLVPKKALWPKGLAKAWQPSEKGAHNQLRIFTNKKFDDYKNGRDRPDKDKTSKLSPYLHFGNISPRQVWHAINLAEAEGFGSGGSLERYRLEILWREFSSHLLYHFPDLPTQPMNKSFQHFPWRKDKKHLQAWQKGQTGYPIIDAGMRQLWKTGWMHNRVRMITASFLIKDLLIDWRTGAAWFWDTLVDADLGNNSASWQWVAGSGADASPYFRIFNPTLQGQKFDKAGDYVRVFVPELAKLPAKYIHEPWKAPQEVLAKAGVVLGKTYPQPIIDHAKARDLALKALKQTKGIARQQPET